MKAVVVNGKNQEFFRNLTSEEVYGQIGQTGVLTVGAVDEDGVALGAAVVLLDGVETGQLLWLYVAEERRREGAATFLYETIARAIRTRGYQKIFSVFRDDKDRDDVLFFMMAQSDTMFVPIPEDIVIVPAAGLNEKLESANISAASCLEFNRIPSFSLRKLLADMSQEEREKAGFFGDDPVDYSAYQECSCGLLDQKDLKGLFMVQNTEDAEKYVLDYFVSQGGGPQALLKMLKYSMEKMLQNSPQAELAITTMNGLGEAVGGMVKEQARTVVYTGAVTNIGEY